MPGELSPAPRAHHLSRRFTLPATHRDTPTGIRLRHRRPVLFRRRRAFEPAFEPRQPLSGLAEGLPELRVLLGEIGRALLERLDGEHVDAGDVGRRDAGLALAEAEGRAEVGRGPPEGGRGPACRILAPI